MTDAVAIDVDKTVIEVSVSEQNFGVSVDSDDNIAISVSNEPKLVSVNQDNVQVVTAGIQGAPGISEDEIMYAKRVDFVTDVLTYRGEAPVGTLDTEASWRIRKIIFDAGDGDDIEETWADGNAQFDNIWDDRAGLSYS